MPPNVKPGSRDRYWREVEGLSRLAIALERDETLTDGERRAVVQPLARLKEQLTALAKGRAA
jgi:hypothetical protein